MSDARNPAAAAPDGVAARALIDAMRASGAERIDPAGLRLIEAIARRAEGRSPRTCAAVEGRLARAVVACRERLDRAEREARERLAAAAAVFPDARDAMTQHCDERDFNGLRGLIAKLETQRGGGRVTELLARLGGHAADAAASTTSGSPDAPAAPQRELKSLMYFRRTWSRLSVDRQLAAALAHAPENAGPLNSHFLLLRSLKLMRDLSPDYLVEFMSYVDTLLWLEDIDDPRSPARKTATASDRDRKRKRARGLG